MELNECPATFLLSVLSSQFMLWGHDLLSQWNIMLVYACGECSKFNKCATDVNPLLKLMWRTDMPVWVDNQVGMLGSSTCVEHFIMG